MGREIGGIILCLLAVYGAAELIIRLSRRLWLPKGLTVAAVIPLSSRDERLELTLHRTTEEMLRERGYSDVFFVDTGLTPSARELVRCLSETEEYSTVISPEKLCEKLQFM